MDLSSILGSRRVKNQFDFCWCQRIFTMKLATLRLQYLVIVSVCLHVALSHGFCHESLHDRIKVVTYGEPCNPSRNLPIRIEVPRPPVEPRIPLCYKPLKLTYTAVSEPEFHYPRMEYPISVEVPKAPPVEICMPDPLEGKSYGYNIQAPPPAFVPVLTNYDFNVQVPPPPQIVPNKPVKLLKGLCSRIDRVLLPACEMPSCNCRN